MAHQVLKGHKVCLFTIAIEEEGWKKSSLLCDLVDLYSKQNNW